MDWSDRRSAGQQIQGILAVTLAGFELAYGWFVAGAFGNTPNARLIITTLVLGSFILLNGLLLFGASRPALNWLRILSLVSIGIMLAPWASIFVAEG